MQQFSLNKIKKLMKKVIWLLALIVSVSACSSDDASPNGGDSSVDYYPLKSANTWKYSVVNDQATTQDVLSVTGQTTIAGKNYFTMEAENVPTGFYTSSVNGQSLRNENNTVYMTGALDFNLGEMFPVDLQLNDFILVKSSAANAELLSTMSGSMSQTFENIPLTASYTLSTINQNSLPSYTSQGVVYNDVKVVKLALNMKVVATVSIGGFPLNFTILDSQDVVSSIQYYAKNVGMVHAETTIGYNLQDLSSFPVQLPIPQSQTAISNEFLLDYQLN